MDPEATDDVQSEPRTVRPRRLGKEDRGVVRNWPSHRQAPVARGLAVGLWALVVLGALGGVAGLVSLGRGGSGPAAAAGQGTETSSRAAETFAELFVMTWLSAGEGEEEELRQFTDSDVSLTGRSPDALRATWVGTQAVELVEPGYWSITVAAVVEQAAAGGYERLGVQRYRVPVLAGDEGLVVTALPAQVPAPTRIGRPPLEMTARNSLPAGELTDTIERFFGAYLAGQGDVERYVRPGADVRAVDPAPFVSTAVVAGEVREAGDSARASVHVDGTDGGGRVTTTAYTVRLVRRDGRWEVAEMLAAPPLQVVNPKGEQR